MSKFLYTSEAALKTLSTKTLDDACKMADEHRREQREVSATIDAKAMTFLTLVVTVIIALAGITGFVKENAVFLYATVSALAVSVFSAILILFGVISGTSLYLAGERPSVYLDDEAIKYYQKLPEEMKDKGLLWSYLPLLEKCIEHNEKTIVHKAKAYRLAVRFLIISYIVISIGLVVSELFLSRPV